MSAQTEVEIPRERIAAWLADPVRRNRDIYVKVAVAAAMINLFGLVSSLFTMTVYDRVVPNNAFDSLVGLTIGLAIVLVFDFVLRLLRAYFVDVAGARIDAEVGDDIFRQILAMRLDRARGSTGGLAGLVREIETLRDFFASASITALVDVPFIVITLAVIALIGGWMVLVPLVMIPIVVLIALATQPAMERLSAETLGGALGKQAVLVETIGSIETVKSSNAGPLLFKRWDRAVHHHAGVALRQRLVSNISATAATTANMISYAGVVVAGVFAIAAYELTMGGLIACSILAGRAVAPLGSIAQLLTRLNSARTAYREIDKFMANPSEGPAGQGLRLGEVAGKIEFRNVDFRYPDAAEDALSDVNLTIAAGERVALIGPIGSGKSTVLRLMLGLYAPTSGVVAIDGIDIRQLAPDTIRGKIGSLLQDNLLFTGTIRDNILLERIEHADVEMLRAAQVSFAHDFIARLPDGYDLRLSDRGDGLSGGQRQSIALARALVGRPPIVILDEPTSAVDGTTEARLIDNLKPELEGRTLVLITHRPSMLKLVDRVIVMSRGKVFLDGPPESIMKQSKQLPVQ